MNRSTKDVLTISISMLSIGLALGSKFEHCRQEAQAKQDMLNLITQNPAPASLPGFVNSEDNQIDEGCDGLTNNALAGYMPIDDHFDDAICGGRNVPKLTCNKDDFPPACLVFIDIDELANEQTPRRAYKSSVGYLPCPISHISQ